MVGYGINKTIEDTITLPIYKKSSGDTSPMVFRLFDTSGDRYDLTNYTMTWKLSKSNDMDNVIIEKSLTNGISLLGINEIKVNLTCEDTENLSGSYTHQVDIYSGEGDHFVVCKGKIEITNSLGNCK